MRKKKKKFQLIESNCRRCGCTIYTGNRSLLGLDCAKKKFGEICSDCITPEEREEMKKLRPIINH